MIGVLFPGGKSGCAMKVRVLEVSSAMNSPITLQVTIDNDEELKELWHRLNVSFVAVKSASMDDVDYPVNIMDDAFGSLWDVLDGICVSKNLKLRP